MLRTFPAFTFLVIVHAPLARARHKVLCSQLSINNERLSQEAAFHVDIAHVRRNLIHRLRSLNVLQLHALADVTPLLLLSNLLE